MKSKKKDETFPSASEDARAAELSVPSRQTLSPSYRLAYMDHDFLLKDELRPVRLELELLKPELILTEHRIESTIVIFGGTRIPELKVAHEQLADAEAAASKDPANELLARKVKIGRRVVEKSKYYEEARRLASLISPSPSKRVFSPETRSGRRAKGGSWGMGHRRISKGDVAENLCEDRRPGCPSPCMEI
jgi:hypothetical protein